MQPTAGILIPEKVASGVYLPEGARPKKERPPRPSPKPRKPPQPQQQPEEEEQQPPIDPDLFSMYPEPEGRGQYTANNYPYPSTEQNASYGYQSLEQIASQVLDMNGGHHEEFLDPAINGTAPHEHVHVYEANDTAPMPNGLTKPDESVDSAVSLSNGVTNGTNGSEQNGLTNGHHPHGAESNADEAVFYHGLSEVQRFVEASRQENGEHALPTTEAPAAQLTPKTDVSSLPLYKPPAPLSLSPEATRRAADAKRKRDSFSMTPGTKKAKLDGVEREDREASVQETEDERLARLLQQEDIGLRRRSK